MQNIVVITENRRFQKELAAVLPRGLRIAANSGSPRNAVVFVDIDTVKGSIRDLSRRNIVIAVTGQQKTATVMEATNFGSYEILLRPLDREAVEGVLREISLLRAETRNVMPLSSDSTVPTCAIVGHSPVIMSLCKKLARLSLVETPVLITGETGTGKELIAESIAQLSSRFGKPFVVVNCAAVPEALLESELFGFEKGSFTGAVSAKEGMLRIADEGCVFLDEVGELPLPLQAKLLRFIQTQAFYPLGSTREVQVNVRVLSATNRNLSSMVREGRFREDLFHRLSVTTLHAPSLRERREDILPLIHFFICRYRHTAPRPIRGFTRAFLKKMISYDWPGNIRELENTLRSAIALSKTDYLTTFEIKDLGQYPSAEDREGLAGSIASAVVPFLQDCLEKKQKDIYEMIHNEVDKSVFEYVLTHTRENQSEAARILGINRLTLRKKLKY